MLEVDVAHASVAHDALDVRQQPEDAVARVLKAPVDPAADQEEDDLGASQVDTVRRKHSGELV